MKTCLYSLSAMTLICLSVGALTFIGVRRTPTCLYDWGHNDSYFGADTARVTGNLTDRRSNHYRTKVHPLASLTLTVPTYVISWSLGVSRLTAMHILIAINATVLSCLLLLLFLRTTGHVLDALVYFLLVASSAAFWFWLPHPESFAFGSTTLVVPVLLASMPFAQHSLLSHFVAGVVSMAIATTNWMSGIFYSVVFLGWKRALSVSMHVLAIVTLLWGVQKWLFPSAEFFLGDREELQYINRQGIPTTTGRFLLSGYAISQPTVREVARGIRGVKEGGFLSMTSSSRVLLVTAYAIWCSLLLIGLWALRYSDMENGFRRVLALTLGGQYCLHMVYSNQTFLYVLHWLPLLVSMCSLTSRSRLRVVGLALATAAAILGFIINIPSSDNALALIR